MSDHPEPTVPTVLRDAMTLLDQGDADAAIRLAQSALEGTRRRADLAGEARLLAFLGHADRLMSRFRRAHDACQRAAFLSRQAGDVEGEAYALAILAYVASCLGRDDDAIEAGLLCCRLSELAPARSLRAIAHNNLGIAYFWSHCHGQAQAVLDRALEAASEGPWAVNPFQPALNKACAESCRLLHERVRGGALPDTARLSAYVDDTVALCGREGALTALQGGMRVTINAMLLMYRALADVWRLQADSGERHLAAARQWTVAYGRTTWLDALEHWVTGELLAVRGDLPGAIACFQQSRDISITVEHEHMASLMQLTLIHFHEAQGDPVAALAEFRRLRSREVALRAEMLASRERVVQWQLEARAQDERFAALEHRSRELERLSLEDPLTGIANRRCLEAALTAEMDTFAQTGVAPSLVFIDIDRFKAINDHHGHDTGDRVLQAVAALVRACTREGDTAARLAGDEFVLLLPRTDGDTAGAVGRRVERAVADHP